MDRISDLGNTLSNLTMYDIKSMYNQAKNVVLNVSEMEAKVREATNDDPWGASSTLMTEIAQGTFNFQNFNEIMPCIYSQFMEKEAKQWRQIYKSLQLLEYLVKHGSERVVDDARSHISTLKMLRSFHYIDDKGKDQGINVRNRSRELVELLSDVEKIRQERRKAKVNKSKYTGTGNDGMSFSSGGSRYGGFGSDSLGGSSFSNYSSGSGGYGASASGYDREYGSGGSGGGGGGGGGGSGGFRDESSKKGYEEYDAGEYESPHRSSASEVPSSSRAPPTRRSTAPAPAPKPVESSKVVDLLGFDDDEPLSGGGGFATDKALPALTPPAAPADSLDDDFADFVAAPTSPQTVPVPASGLPAAAGLQAAKPNLMELLNASAPAARSPAMSPQSQGSLGSFGVMPSGVQSPPLAPAGSPPMFSQPALTPASRTSSVASPSPPASAPKPSGGGFDDLWKTSLGSSAKPAAPAGPAKSIKDLAKEKTQAGIWGAATARPASMGSGSGFGSFAAPAASTTQSSAAADADDLLL